MRTLRPVKIAVPDLVSNSYFPAVAAVHLGCFAKEGLDATLELIFPVDRCYRELKSGNIDFVAGSAHSALAEFPEWKGVKLLCAQAQGMYWFLVVRSDLKAARGDLACLKGLRIGAAPWVDMGLRQLLVAAGIDVAAEDVRIAPVPGANPAPGQLVNFGVTAAQALGDGLIDAFWANGMGAEVAVQSGWGDLVLDVRRGDGPPEAFNFTLPSIAATERLVQEEPEVAQAAVRAIRQAHVLLRADPSIAETVGDALFPPREASLITKLIARDLPYYDAKLTPSFVQSMNEFSRNTGILSSSPGFDEVVATELRPLW